MLDLTLAQVALAGVTGFLSVYLLRALGHKDLAGLMKTASAVLVASGFVNLVAQTIASFREAPVVKALIWILERVK